MQTPFIHLNGTSKRVLIDQQLQILPYLDQAMRALLNSAPHMRDYYPYGSCASDGNEAHDRAVKEFTQRVHVLRDLIKEIETFTGLIDVK